MREVLSLGDLFEKLGMADTSALLLLKAGSETSDCAYLNLSDAGTVSNVQMLYADVTTVRDIHPVFNVSTVPALLVFEGRELKNIVKACQTSDFYKNLLRNSFYVAKAVQEVKTSKNVTVYSTPTCTWCNTLKTWLNKNGVRYRDVDISRDPGAAKELVRRSGQQGVPQTDINGRIVVGFDQNKLKELLDIK